ncbi:MAG: hypothetical protein Q9217_003943 [Psora testacea]
MPRSILEHPLQPPKRTPSAASREDRLRETALYHANLIQQRKDIQAQILAATEALLELPSSSDSDPGEPSREDATFVRTTLGLFQTSDYEALIVERNINTQCGYILCPRPNRQQATNAKYRILYGRGKGPDALRFVEKGSLERWCSDDCGKRALFIKVQLNEEPAWTRRPGTGRDLVLLEDNDSRRDSHDEAPLVNAMRDLDIDLDEGQVIEQMKTLALERGDGNVCSRSLGLVEVKENNIMGKGDLRDNDQSCINHDSIEGYQPRFGSNRIRQEVSEVEPEEDMIGMI